MVKLVCIKLTRLCAIAWALVSHTHLPGPLPPFCHFSAPQTVTVCLYSPQTTPRLRQGGMEFAV